MEVPMSLEQLRENNKRMEYIKYAKLMAKMNRRTNIPQPPVPQFEQYCRLFIADDMVDVLMDMKPGGNSEEELRALYHGADWDACLYEMCRRGLLEKRYPKDAPVYYDLAPMGLVTAQMASAISSSSVCRRGLWLPRWLIFIRWMGSITPGAIRGSFLSMPASAFTALSRQADAAPSRAEVLPVTMSPSGSSMATAGPPVASARSSAAATTGRSPAPIPSKFISSSIFFTSAGSDRPCREDTAAAYQRRRISCLEAPRQTSSSVMQ